jgi:hypothetical protein
MTDPTWKEVRSASLFSGHRCTTFELDRCTDGLTFCPKATLPCGQDEGVVDPVADGQGARKVHARSRLVALGSGVSVIGSSFPYRFGDRSGLFLDPALGDDCLGAVHPGVGRLVGVAPAIQCRLPTILGSDQETLHSHDWVAGCALLCEDDRSADPFVLSERQGHPRTLTGREDHDPLLDA